jgi:CDP-diacylglycerol--glycerol-3-phosphate 3-phosphatidyltransferase
MGVTANQVTVVTCILSALLGSWLAFVPGSEARLLLLPAFLLIRMALNAIDGMLAREFGQKSNLGGYLNELADVVSDSFLYLPFAYQPGFDALWVGLVIVLAVISEMTGTVAVMTGASRRYDGPMGKSDRALAFGALALWLGIHGPGASWLCYWFPKWIAVLLMVTIANRVRNGLAEANSSHAKSVGR